MYGKLFAQMYNGTLGTKGPWQALVTFQQMVILADKNGVVDMTAEAIARHTTIPLEIIKVGLVHLQEPDPDSRSPDEDGRRIVLLSDHRAWGWRVVNYGHYRKIRSEEERREYHRQYMRKRRSVNSDVKESTGSDQCQPIAVSSKQEASNAFTAFWSSYPRKEAKQVAMKAFLKLKLGNGDLDKIMSALDAAKKTDQWQREDGKYIPHAATWLNQRRFEDEITPPPAPTVAMP